MKVKVIGAGSIGNHLTQAARRMGWEVTVVDRDPEALARMRNQIYPARYGVWDESIQLFNSANEPKGGFDVICIGTPPDVRMKLAILAIQERPKVLLLEKPLCTPDFAGLQDFLDVASDTLETTVLVGYDHAVSQSIRFVSSLLQTSAVGKVLTLDVEFRESWDGIFKAHPWLSGPADSYLGYTARGGGASGEHSHALHLFNHLALEAGLGQIVTASSLFQMEKLANGGEYDSFASFQLLTEADVIGRVVQDVITKPTRKWARVQGDKGFIEWFCNGHSSGDLVRFQTGDRPEPQENIFPKKRPDDFFQEMLHIQEVLDGNITNLAIGRRSPISLNSGLLVMEILKSANLRNSDRLVDLPQLDW